MTHNWLTDNKRLVILGLAIFLLTLLPVADAFITIGSSWRGVPQTYQDEILYFAQVREIIDGHPFFGNPYFLEHQNDPTLAFFGANWISAIPLFFGLSFSLTMYVNFVIWSFVFVCLLYYLFRRFNITKNISTIGALFVYIQSYNLVYRTSVRQTVFPFFLLFYIALLNWFQKPTDKKSIIFLAVISGISFYIYGFLWQVVAGTLFCVCIYAIASRDKEIIRSSIFVSAGAFIIALPMMIGTWRTMHLPYYWESMNRFGLVNTHLPTAEVLYSGGWVIIALLLLYFGYAVLRRLQNSHFLTGRCISSSTSLLFFLVTGCALVIVQASNLITGKELELAQHIRNFIIPWLAIALFFIISRLIIYEKLKKMVSVKSRCLLGSLFFLLICANIYFISFLTLFPQGQEKAVRLLQQLYSAPLTWLDNNVSEPVVVWSNPHNYLTLHIPTLTKHYVLYAEPGTLELLSNKEIIERYLTSSYFDNVTAEYLKKDIAMYAGRANVYHYPRTILREAKICHIIQLVKKDQYCPIPKNPIDLLGDDYFINLEKKYVNEIRPHITDYLRKYHVSYIIKDKVLDATYRVEELPGTIKVYEDERFVIYHIN